MMTAHSDPHRTQERGPAGAGEAVPVAGLLSDAQLTELAACEARCVAYHLPPSAGGCCPLCLPTSRGDVVAAATERPWLRRRLVTKPQGS